MPTNEQIIYELLTEFKGHRSAVMQMVTDIEVLKEKIDKLIPETLDSRYVRFFEEKVKTVTEFFRTLLEMRKEIQKSLKDEIDIRRRIDINESSLDIENIIDIRKLADKVEDFKKKRDEIKKKSVKSAQEETDRIAVEVKRINVGVGGTIDDR